MKRYSSLVTRPLGLKIKFCSTETRDQIGLKGYGFLSFAKI